MPKGIQGFQKGHPDFTRNHRGGFSKKDVCKRGHLRTPDNLYGRSTCKECHHILAYEWKRRDNLKKVGLTPEGWNILFEKQGGRCAICMKHQTELKMKLVVDHEHASGKIRDLLCHACNLVLGNAREDASILQRCINYLKIHEDQSL